MSVKLKKKAGDGFPLDVLGHMIYIGSTVAVPMLFCNTEGQPNSVEQRLGVVKKLFKNGKAEIQVYHAVGIDELVKIDKANTTLIVIDGETLNPKVPLFEALKMAGKHAEYLDLNK